MKIDPEKKKAFENYLKDILPGDSKAPHPFARFTVHEIVRDTRYGPGIITGFRIPDFDREMEGLGVQFVVNGEMTDHVVYTPDESLSLIPSGVVYDVKIHGEHSLEEVLESHGTKIEHTPEVSGSTSSGPDA